MLFTGYRSMYSGIRMQHLSINLKLFPQRLTKSLLTMALKLAFSSSTSISNLLQLHSEAASKNGNNAGYALKYVWKPHLCLVLNHEFRHIVVDLGDCNNSFNISYEKGLKYFFRDISTWFLLNMQGCISKCQDLTTNESVLNSVNVRRVRSVFRNNAYATLYLQKVLRKF